MLRRMLHPGSKYHQQNQFEYQEDCHAQVDANFVLTENGNIVEIQGTAEEKPFTTDEYALLLDLAKKGISDLINIQKEAIKNAKI